MRHAIGLSVLGSTKAFAWGERIGWGTTFPFAIQHPDMIRNLLEAVTTIKRSVADCLTSASIERACQAENHRWRQRDLGPAKTLQAFVLQVLHGNTACTHTVRLAHLNCSAEAYCQSRARLPLSVYRRLLDETSQAARRSCRLPLWHGHRTFLIDGSSFSMPDTPELQAVFGQSGAQRAGCGFPIAHWLTMFDARSGLLVRQLALPLRTHEMSQVAALHPELNAGDVLVGDTAFASYAHLALLSQRKLHGVFRVHQRQLVSFRKDRKLVGKANSLSLVRFDTNDYSVPTAYAHHHVTAVGNIQEVRLIVNDRVVARHPRDWARENVHYDPLHYLALLERKPGSLDFARPLEDWHLPECFGVLRRRLEGERQSDGRREFIRVLRWLETLELAELSRAVERALAIGALTVDAIRILAQQGREQPSQWFSLDGRPHLQGHEIPAPHLDRYASLLLGGDR